MVEKRRVIRFFAATTTFFSFLAVMNLMSGQVAESVEDRLPKLTGRTLSPYFLISADDAKLDQFPLEETKVRVQAAGVIARVEVTQIWKNRGQNVIEAVYVFPASTRAAVHDLVMRIGDRTIRAEIARRLEAQKVYEEARRSGRTASLLEEDRPNVFKMSVANILPGDRIEVTLTYTELIPATEGWYELVLSTVVGPRYSNQPAEGAKDRDQFVETPYLPPGFPAPSALDIEVILNAGMTIEEVNCPTHPVEVEKPSPGSAMIRLKDHMGGNRDFMLRYRLSGEKIQSGLLLFEGEEENFFLLLIEPPTRIQPADLPPREYVFILDVSGSMAGIPIDIAKEIIVKLLGELRDIDSFNIVLFESRTTVFSKRSLPATDKNISEALLFISRASGSGGTEMARAMEKALRLPSDPGRSRSLIVCTDGYVSFEAEVFRLVEENLDLANLFAIGIGSSVNRFLIEGLARAGRGEPFVVTRPGSEDADRFMEYVSSPVLTDILIRFDGFSIQDVTPRKIPDLFAARSLAIFGRWRAPLTGRIIMSGMTAQGLWEQRIDTTRGEISPGNSALRELWARERVAELVNETYGYEQEEIVEAIIALGIKYRLLTPYTSFVSVDTRTRTEESPERVEQPLPLPEGAPASAVGGVGSGTAGTGMSFGLLEMWSSTGYLDRLAGLVLLASAVAAILVLLKMFGKFFRLKHQLREYRRFLQPHYHKSQEGTTKADPCEITSPEVRAAVQLVTLEPAGAGLLTKRIVLREALALLMEPLIRLARLLDWLGAAILFSGLVGALSSVYNGLRGLILTQARNSGDLFAPIASEAIRFFIFALVGALGCLGAGSLFRIRALARQKETVDSLIPVSETTVDQDR